MGFLLLLLVAETVTMMPTLNVHLYFHKGSGPNGAGKEVESTKQSIQDNIITDGEDYKVTVGGDLNIKAPVKRIGKNRYQIQGINQEVYVDPGDDYKLTVGGNVEGGKFINHGNAVAEIKGALNIKDPANVHFGDSSPEVMGKINNMAPVKRIGQNRYNIGGINQNVRLATGDGYNLSDDADNIVTFPRNYGKDYKVTVGGDLNIKAPVKRIGQNRYQIQGINQEVYVAPGDDYNLSDDAADFELEL